MNLTKKKFQKNKCDLKAQRVTSCSGTKNWTCF